MIFRLISLVLIFVAQAMFCATIRKYPDIEEKVKSRGKIDCESNLSKNL